MSHVRVCCGSICMYIYFQAANKCQFVGHTENVLLLLSVLRVAVSRGRRALLVSSSCVVLVRV